MTSRSACSSTPTGRSASAGGTVSLYANDEKIGEGRIEKTVSVRFSGYAGMDVGRDNGLVVDRAYAAKAPYAFTGTVKKVVFDLKPGSHDDEKALHEAERARRRRARHQRLGTARRVKDGRDAHRGASRSSVVRACHRAAITRRCGAGARAAPSYPRRFCVSTLRRA